MTENTTALPPCMIFVSKEGKWYHQGAEIIHRPVFLWMIQSLELTEDGAFIVHLNNQKCVLEVEDTPLVIVRADLVPEAPGEPEHIMLTLNDERQEKLDPESLRINADNVLYCKVKTGQIPARFLRAAYYQVAEYLDEGESGGFVLTLNKRQYPVKDVTN